MITIKNIGLLALAVALPVGGSAYAQSTEPSQENTWTGKLTAVNAQDNRVKGEHWRLAGTRTFNLGRNCAISTIDKKEASLSDLRPGERVWIRYRDVEGVLVTDRIVEQGQHFRGTVGSIDSKDRTVTMTEAPLYEPFRSPKSLRLADDCKILLWNGKEGTLPDMHPGDRITAMYESREGGLYAYRIMDRSTTFDGSVEAIDLSARSLKAKNGSGDKDFDLADHCRILLGGDKTGHLKDLQVGQHYRFTYESVDGVNILDRIVPVPASRNAQTGSTS